MLRLAFEGIALFGIAQFRPPGGNWREGPDHPDTLTTRGNIAFWTGQCGDAGEALRLFEALLPT